MKKLKIIICVVILFLAGAATGYLLRTPPKPNETVTTTEKKSEPEITVLDKDTRTGQYMTPTQLYEQLQSMPPGDDFDQTYLTYLAMLRSNETGMSRIAADKATRPELKKIAGNQMQLSSDLVTELYGWQKIWGFTDH
jgi:hypothetical protein